VLCLAGPHVRQLTAEQLLPAQHLDREGTLWGGVGREEGDRLDPRVRLRKREV
jgi:hypothetical protein